MVIGTTNINIAAECMDICLGSSRAEQEKRNGRFLPADKLMLPFLHGKEKGLFS